MRKTRMTLAILLAAALSPALAAAPAQHSVSSDAKTVGTTVKHDAKTVGRTVKSDAKTFGVAVKHTAIEIGHAAKRFGLRVASATKQGVHELNTPHADKSGSQKP